MSTRILMFGFGLIFVLAGVAVIYFITIDPLLTWRAAQQWTPTPCTILGSSVETHRDDDGDTYSIAVTYSYEFGGETFTGERYSISTGSSSGRSGKQEVVDGYPPGSEQTCYVDPLDPSQALLTRDFMWDTLFGLFGLLFLVPGLLVAGAGIYSVGTPRSEQGQALRERFAAARSSSGSVPLWDGHVPESLPDFDRSERPQELEGTSPWITFWVMVFVAAFWNGITWTIVIVSWEEASNSLLACFLVPFVLIGLGLAVGLVHSFLALFNPRLRVQVNAAAVRMGDRLRIDWRFEGRATAIQQLTIKLIGKEHATFRQGTSTSTRDATFLEQVLFDGSGSYRVASGSCHVQLPELVPSFEGGSNAIRYVIEVHGDIPRWPDVKNEYPIVVLPQDYPRGG